MKTKVITLLFILGISILSGCDIFPYVTQPTVQPTPSTTSPQSSPTSVSATATAQITPTPTERTVEITRTLEPTAQHTPFPFTLQAEYPFYLVNFNHPGKGCQWMGVAGQVFDHLGQPQLGLIVRVGGLSGDPSILETTTGLAIAYGPGGFEIQLGDSPLDTQDTYWIRVFDVDHKPLTKRYYFDTFNNCKRNLVLLNFVSMEIPENKEPVATLTVPAYP